MTKPQRIRDPVHDLIEFSTDEFDQLAWRIINCHEFQRLRRIRQLGFSELVFPGATHTRFAHSIGVYATARKLASVIKSRLGEAASGEREKIAMLAALIHDVGHRPFSHTFEKATRKLKIERNHEDWTAEIIRGNTEIGREIEDTMGREIRSNVAEIIASEVPSDIYASIVSSQFDADRLDYVWRDRLMTGVQHGGFDASWLLANLEVEKIVLTKDSEKFAEVDGLVLHRKAFQAAEAYVLGLFHLYFTVYFHKTTRAAEVMLTAIVTRLGELIQAEQLDTTGLGRQNALVAFLADPTLDNFLRIDDSVFWTSIQTMTEARDPDLAELTTRLLRRKLYRAIDVGARFGTDGSAEAARVGMKIANAMDAHEFGPADILEDRVKRSPYNRKGDDTPEVLSQVLIRKSNGTSYMNLADASRVVDALKTRSIYRVYVRNGSVAQRVEQFLEEERS
jgi:hypothetical protein